jgi:hippurate hydrolase
VHLGHFSTDRVMHAGPAPASEDFGCFATALRVPSVFWFVGGTDPGTYAKAREAGRLNDIPVNHSPRFAPVIHPTLETGVEALIVAAWAWLRAQLSSRFRSIQTHRAPARPVWRY